MNRRGCGLDGLRGEQGGLLCTGLPSGEEKKESIDNCLIAWARIGGTGRDVLLSLLNSGDVFRLICWDMHGAGAGWSTLELIGCLYENSNSGGNGGRGVYMFE
jgi:hypothetical protein